MASNFRGKIALIIGSILLLESPQLLAQANAQQTIGSLQTQGFVAVGGTPVTSGLSLYAGDTIQTGADGSGSLGMQGRGTLVIGANTEIAFLSGQLGERFASLHRGSIALRLAATAPVSPLELGKFVVTNEIGVEMGAEVERSPDGTAAHVRCLNGSVGVIALEGAGSIFLHPGEELDLSGDSSMRRHGAAAPSQPTTSTGPSTGSTPTAAGKSHTAVILLGVGGGAAAAVAALLITQHGQAISPTAP
jgi:hypothetical protein